MSERFGGCLCGSIRYTIRNDPRAVTSCYCSHCRKQSGSVLSINWVCRAADFDLSGEPKMFVDTGDSGDPVNRYFCPACGSPIFATISSAPGKIVVKAGTLDEIPEIPPQAQIYADQRAPWAAPVRDARTFAKWFVA